MWYCSPPPTPPPHAPPVFICFIWFSFSFFQTNRNEGAAVYAPQGALKLHIYIYIYIYIYIWACALFLGGVTFPRGATNLIFNRILFDFFLDGVQMLLNVCCVFIALPTTLLHNISTSLPPLCANRSFHCLTFFFQSCTSRIKKEKKC